MKITFDYSKEKDIWCLLNYGKSSFNSPTPTKVYEKLIEECGENPTEENTSLFIERYLTENRFDIQEFISNYQKDWEVVSEQYIKRAEAIFQVKLPQDITVYLTINNRCPYNIKENHFFVSVPAYSPTKTVMHELWHFYTWYKFGSQEEKVGKQKYNDIKEALTVLLNVEFKDLLPEGVRDNGYPQHRALREEMIKTWNQEKDIEKLWNKFINL